MRPYAPLFRSITTSERLANLKSDSHRLFYSWLLTVVDDWGRVTASPKKLTALVWPMLGKKAEETEKALEDLRQTGLITIHESDDGPFVQIPDHEDKSGSIGKKDHRKASHWPDSMILARLGPDWPAMARTGPDWPSRTGADAPPSARGSCSSSGSQSGSGKESREREPAPSRQVSDYWCLQFQAVRGVAYVWSGGKDGKALSALLKANPDVQDIKARIDRFLADPFWAPKADWTKFCSQFNAMAPSKPSEPAIKPVDPEAIQDFIRRRDASRMAQGSAPTQNVDPERSQAGYSGNERVA